jgi:hypothetical protein
MPQQLATNHPWAGSSFRRSRLAWLSNVRVRPAGYLRLHTALSNSSLEKTRVASEASTRRSHELFPREMDLPVTDGDLAARGVDLQFPQPEDRVVAIVPTSQDRPDPALQLVEGKRLGEVVVDIGQRPLLPQSRQITAGRLPVG